MWVTLPIWLLVVFPSHQGVVVATLGGWSLSNLQKTFKKHLPITKLAQNVRPTFNSMKFSFLRPGPITLLLLTACCLTNRPNANAQPVHIPLGGNAFQISSRSTEEITDQGIERWQHNTTEYALYFSLHTTHAVQLALPLIEQSGNSTLSISVNGAVKDAT